jgi:quercetin dioxygenase-like cupin family protein
MSNPASAERVAHVVDPLTAETLDVLGATVQFLTPPDEEATCVMRGVIPPGGVVPLHSHADPETFLAISGEVEGLVHTPEGFGWTLIRPGDVFHVPGDERHAFRNQSREPAVNVIVTTARIARFFREIGAPIAPGTTAAAPPSADVIEHFLETSERYGYWNATPRENADVFILPPVGAEDPLA